MRFRRPRSEPADREPADRQPAEADRSASAIMTAPSDAEAADWGARSAQVAADPGDLAGDVKADELWARGRQRLAMALNERVDELTEAVTDLRGALRRRWETTRRLAECRETARRAEARRDAHREAVEARDCFGLLPEIPHGLHWWLLLTIAVAEAALNWPALIELGMSVPVTVAAALTVGFVTIVAAYIIGMGLRRLLDDPLADRAVASAGGWRGSLLVHGAAASLLVLLVAASYALHVLREAMFAHFDVQAPSWTLWVLQLFFAATAVAVTLLAESPHRRRLRDLEVEADRTAAEFVDANAADEEAAAAVYDARGALYARVAKTVNDLRAFDDETRCQFDQFGDGAQQVLNQPVRLTYQSQLVEALRLVGGVRLLEADWELKGPAELASDLARELCHAAGDTDPAEPADPADGETGHDGATPEGGETAGGGAAGAGGSQADSGAAVTPPPGLWIPHADAASRNGQPSADEEGEHA
jgi:hypothetical protein